ncbi:branched-chain amino acid ABC transporter permease [Falsochrobactrum shanghaiense]|uniref:Branched-chain amino acid ABC transporter permease n=1 Tax=Falsochrobactrum shanghaiense TaxID=2201899 RepID=A0A316JCT6_9HYPH|nr:branched-chain amino acid ABC transporter permease [Falsochrobactrum shanghaiense]PWL18495.1 branched-chain amino acid ABC transporter permease [Falsochrobactrum shanghaiense]
MSTSVNSVLPASKGQSLLGSHDWITLALVALAFIIPLVSVNPQILSQTNLILIAATGALGVYIMQRLDLMSFAVPSFMAIGGYTVAVLSLRVGITDVFVLGVCAFVVPALCAIPLGSLILKLKGVYFVLVTFVLSEIVQLLLFELEPLTGGANGLVGMPAVTIFGMELWDNSHVLLTTCGLAFTGFVITAVFTRWFRYEFAAIETNDVLAESLGLAAWKYKAMAFAVAAGVSGFAGFALVNMLMTAHPTSFAPMSSVSYITYTIVGGKRTILGTLVGAILLVSATDYFALSGEMSPGLFGLLIIVVTLVARGGVVGVATNILRRLMQKGTAATPAASALAVEEKKQ